MSTLVKLGVVTLRKIVEPKWLHPGAVLENGETAPGLEPFWLHFFPHCMDHSESRKTNGPGKSVHRDEVSTKMGCPQGEVLLYIQGIQLG